MKNNRVIVGKKVHLHI